MGPIEKYNRPFSCAADLRMYNSVHGNNAMQPEEYTMQRPNIAVKIINALGFGHMLAAAKNLAGTDATALMTGHAMTRRTQRWGRNSQVRERRKAEFTQALNQGDVRPAHTKLARKAALGEVGLMGRPRGLQVRMVAGVLRVTR